MPALTVAAVLILLVLCGLPFAAVAAEVLAQPAALGEALGSARLWGLLGSTCLLGLLVTAGCCLVGVPVGALLARSRGRLAGLTLAVLPVPLVLPPWILGLSLTAWLPLSGLVGSAALLTASLWPIVALFARRGFRAAARAGEAARVLAGPGARTTWRVDLPLALPSLLSGALLAFVFAVTDFAAVDFLSFADPEPFVVLSSEIFQRWARLQSGAGAAAASLFALLPTLVALALVLACERRHEGRQRGTPAAATLRAPGPAESAALGLVLLWVLWPVGLLGAWASGVEEPLAALASARPAALASVQAALAAGALVALGGVVVARASLAWRGGPGTALLAASLLPLAAPAVMFAVGEVRLWNHPANPLADLVHPSPVLLVLALAGRFLPLGVLAARALLLRMDEGPFLAARAAGRPAWRTALAIQLPMLAPAAGQAALLGYLLSMRELDMLVLIPAGSATLAHRIFSLVHIASDDLTALLCLLLVALALLPALAARWLGVTGPACGPGEALG